MIMIYKYLQFNKHIIKNTMLFIPQIWVTFAFVCGLTLASSALGETGPLTIEKMECEGNQKTSCEYIVAQTRLQEGETLVDEKVRESRLRLELLGFFDEVDIRLSKGSEVGKTKLVISVKERDDYSYNASVSTFVGARVLGFGDLTGIKQNISGQGDSLSVRVRTNQYSNIHQYLGRIEYTRPFLTLPRAYIALGLGGGYENDSYDYSSWSFNSNSSVYNIWSDIALGYKIFNYSFVTAGYRHFLNGYHSSAFIQTGWDSQDNATFPTQGSRLIFTADWNDYPFYRHYYRGYHNISLTLSYLHHWELADRHILSLRLGGFQRGTDPAFRLTEEQPEAIRYTYQFRRHATNSTVQNGAVYFEPGLAVTWPTRYPYYFRPGLKVGTNLETKYGIINLSFLGVIE